MVLALSPAARPISVKLAPIKSFDFEGVCASAANRAPGRARPRTSLKESINAERLRDLRKVRREEDKRESTFPALALATIRRYFYSERLPNFASLRDSTMQKLHFRPRTNFDWLALMLFLACCI